MGNSVLPHNLLSMTDIVCSVGHVTATGQVLLVKECLCWLEAL